jgi:peptidoglycan/LPS O-acetylase OafA/YrhL
VGDGAHCRLGGEPGRLPGYAPGRTSALEDRSGHLANLDLLRACAVVAVYCGHLGLLWNVDGLGSLSLKALSQGGVALFFVHTSYVLMRSLERLPAQDRAVRFYVRRAFRIYPLSILVVLAVLALRIPPFPTRPYLLPGWGGALSNLGLVQNLTLSPSVIDPLWSLPYEVQMYVVLPALFVLVTRPRAPAPLYVWLASVALALAQETSSATRLDVIRYAPCFLAGVLAFAEERQARQDPKDGRWSWMGFPLVILAALGLRQLGLEAGWVGCLLLGLAVGRFRQVDVRWIRAVAAWIARYSYGIYLAHLPVFWVAFVLLRGVPLAAQIGVCAALSVLLPVALYHWLEAPMVARGASLAARIGAGPVTAAPRGVVS